MTTAPWVGDPLAFGLGAIVLVAYAFAKSWTESLVTVAHEGGHMATLARSAHASGYGIRIGVAAPDRGSRPSDRP